MIFYYQIWKCIFKMFRLTYEHSYVIKSTLTSPFKYIYNQFIFMHIERAKNSHTPQIYIYSNKTFMYTNTIFFFHINQIKKKHAHKIAASRRNEHFYSIWDFIICTKFPKSILRCHRSRRPPCKNCLHSNSNWRAEGHGGHSNIIHTHKHAERT